MVVLWNNVKYFEWLGVRCCVTNAYVFGLAFWGSNGL